MIKLTMNLIYYLSRSRDIKLCLLFTYCLLLNHLCCNVLAQSDTSGSSVKSQSGNQQSHTQDSQEDITLQDKPAVSQSSHTGSDDKHVNVGVPQNDNEPQLQSNSKSDERHDSTAKPTMKSEITPLELYRKLFKQKRKTQLDAVKNIVNIGGYDKQYKMVKIILEKMFKVLTEAKVVLMEAGFSPGDAFPEEMKTKEALSHIVENTVFFGDILLRLPDITHSLLSKHREWELLAQWGVGFCNDTNVLDTTDGQIISLMGQEMGIIEKSEDYVNPNRLDVQQEKAVKEELETLINEKFKELKKQEKKKKRKDKLKKGPKLSGVRHTEL